ncbi:MAG: nucleotidyltransferase domain-containing protein [Bacteroidetes bacterium]|nr:nucleotidyltransferase domain-containing protein [Bacteroidota bacterium]
MSFNKDDIIARFTERLSPFPVRFAVLYGSYAADRPTPVSDIDLAVYVDEIEDFLDVVVAAEEAFPEHRVDVVNLKGKTALIYYEALASGLSFLIRDDAFFRQEKFRVMREYLDFKPMHDRLLTDMLQRIDEGTYGKPAG